MPDSGAAALIPDTLDASRPDAHWLRLEQVGYRAGDTRILSDITLDLGAGPPTVVIGPNGSGKTTLLRLMMGLIAPTEGRVLLAARADGGERRRAFMFQKPVMLRRTAAANVAFALHASGRSFDEAAVTALLGRVGLAELGRRPARRLSGGEQQRLALARALARAPEILLLDEPTASLDPAQSKAVEEIVADVMRAGVKVVLATHDLGQARRLAGDVVFLANGRLIEHAPASQFFAEPASEAARRFLAGDLVL